ncbi:MAG: VOC family protein [Alphaproteobacteria bacterium]|nr:VOC family protein [Alphaproteobacteria bacterium]
MQFQQQISFLIVSDMKRSRDFYEVILGLELVHVQPSGCRILKVNDGAYLGICDHRRPDQSAISKDNTILCLVDQDVDGWATRLKEMNVVIEKGPIQHEKFDIYHIFFRDPDGYLVEIQRFNNSDWFSSEKNT